MRHRPLEAVEAFIPRHYNSEIRKQRQEELRQRIVEATVFLHAEKGSAFTTYKDIAEKADVAIPSVYKHFPNLSSLFEACTRHAASRAPVQSEQALAACSTLRERVAVLAKRRCEGHAYFHPWLKWGGDRVIAEVVSLMAEDARRTERLIAIALSPVYGDKQIPKEMLSIILVLLGYHSWASLRLERGCSQPEIAKYLIHAICKLVEK